MRPLEVYEQPHCACCGQMVTWNPLVATHEGRALQFCGAQCEVIFGNYLLPSYGAQVIANLEQSCFAPDSAQH